MEIPATPILKPEDKSRPDPQRPGCLPDEYDLDSMLSKEQAAIWLQMKETKLASLVNARLIPAVTFSRKNWRFNPRTCLEFWARKLR
jgi:hypothetical protein